MLCNARAAKLKLPPTTQQINFIGSQYNEISSGEPMRNLVGGS